MPPKSNSGVLKSVKKRSATTSVEESTHSPGVGKVLRIQHPHNLPAEVLSRIFSILADVDLPDPRSNSLGWIVITHVCKRWRSVALEHHSLWATLHGAYGTNLWSTCLQRASGAPLTICDTSGLSVPTFVALHSYGAYVKHLSLFTNNPWALVYIQTVLSDDVSYPSLRTLSIICPTPSDSRMSLPIDFTRNHAPNLHTLELIGLDIPWNFHAPHIRILRVALLSRGAVTLPGDESIELATMENILQTLNEMKNLERLTLRNVIPKPAHHVNVATVMAFPRLRVLELEGPPSSCAILASLLPLQSDALLSVNCSHWTISAQDFATLLSVFRSRLTAVDRPRFTGMKLGCLLHCGQKGFSLELNADRSIDHQDHVSGIHINISFPPRTSPGAQSDSDSFMEFVKLIPMHALSCLEVKGNCPVDLRAFEDAVELKHLHIVECANEDMPLALLPSYTYGDNGQEMCEVFFPRLDTLKISSTYMGCLYYNEVPQNHSRFLYWWDVMIEERPKAGYGPKVLTIEDCSASWMTDMVENWKTRVETVIWDGKGDTELDGDDDAGFWQ